MDKKRNRKRKKANSTENIEYIKSAKLRYPEIFKITTMGRYFASVINSNRIVWTGLSDVLWLK